MSHYRRRRSYSSGPSGAAVACVVAGIALVAVMGVTAMDRSEAKARPEAAPAPKPVYVPAPVAAEAPQPRAKVPRKPLDVIASTIKDAGKVARALRTMDRGEAFNTKRVDTLAKLTDAREKLGEILDAQPSNDRANRLWDRLQLTYVMLKKL